MKLQITKLALSHLMIAASWLSSAAAVEETLTPPAGDSSPNNSTHAVSSTGILEELPDDLATVSLPPQQGGLRGSTSANRELQRYCDRFRRKISVESICCWGDCDVGGSAEVKMRINNNKMWNNFEDVNEGKCTDVRGFDGWRRISTEVLWTLQIQLEEDDSSSANDFYGRTLGPDRWLKEDAFFDPCGTYKRSFTEHIAGGEWQYNLVVEPYLYS